MRRKLCIIKLVNLFICNKYEYLRIWSNWDLFESKKFELYLNFNAILVASFQIIWPIIVAVLLCIIINKKN